MPRGKMSAGRPVADWNIDKIIAAFAGIDPLVVAHREYGFRPLSYSQVSHWRIRHQIPSDRLAEIFVVLDNGHDGTFNPMEYVQSRGRSQ